MNKLKKIFSSILLSLLITVTLPGPVFASAPAELTNLTPAAGSMVSATGLVFDWEDATDTHLPVGYKFEISKTNETAGPGKFVTPYFETTWGQLTTSQLPASAITPALTSGTYFWHVRAGDATGAQVGGLAEDRSPWSVPQLIIVNEAPVASITSPTNNSYVSGEVNIFGSIADENLHHYRVQIERFDGACIYDTGDVTSTSFTNKSLLPYSLWNTAPWDDGTYTISLVATDVFGSIGTSEITVVKDTLPPYIPNLLSPADDIMTKSNPSLAFSWEGKPVTETSDVKFDFEISGLPDVDASGNFEFPNIRQLDLLANTTAVGGLSENTAYFWHVRAKDEAGNASPWSLTRTFITDNLAPVFDNLPDIIANKNKDVSIENLIDADKENVSYLWSEPTGKVVIDNEITSTATLKGIDDGTYDVSVTVTDRAGNSTAKSFKFTWDSTVNPVENLYAVTGDGFVDLHWKNPTDEDFVQIKIVRNTGGDSEEVVLAVLENSEEVYEDESVISGLTYYYQVIAIDELGNESVSKEIKATPELMTFEPQVLTPVVSTDTTDDYTYGYSPNTVKPKTEEKEVKSDENENSDDQKEEGSQKLPTIGVVILIILALIGLYLLYLQNPNWFEFLKRNKKPKKLK